MTMPRRRQPAATPGDAPAKAPRPQSYKPRRKRPAAGEKPGKNAAAPARKRTRPKPKALRKAAVQPQLLLPAPRRLPLLTYAGDAEQISSAVTIIYLPHLVAGPSAPPVADATRQNVRTSRGGQSTAPPNTVAPQHVTPTSPAPIAAGKRRTSAVDPQVVAKVGITAAIIGAVLFLARVTPVKPNAAIVTHASPPIQTALVHDTGERIGTSFYAMASPRHAHHPNAAKWLRTKWDRHIAAHVRIIDGPARMKQTCAEQTWPYIADYCLTVAEDNVTAVHANSVAAQAAVPIDAVDAAAPHATIAAATTDVPPALTLDAGHATGGPDTSDGVIERVSYRMAAISDDTAAKVENQKPEPAQPRHYQPRRDQPVRAYARPRQGAPAAVRAAAVRYALQPRHQAPRYVAFARARQWPVRRFAGGPAYGFRPYASEQSAFYAPWY
jgi:hypothetical protein